MHAIVERRHRAEERYYHHHGMQSANEPEHTGDVLW